MDEHLRELATPTEAANNIVNLYKPADGQDDAKGQAAHNLATAGFCIERECMRVLYE